MALGDTISTSTLTMTFDDEFNNFTSSPDGGTGLWRTTLLNGDRTLGSNGEQEYYSDSSVGENPFSVSNGVLDIQATPGSNALGLPYNSGVITTENSFNQLYGYFEIDAKMPAGQGLWPAFWLLPASGAWPPELDAFEVLGNNPTTLYFSTHSSVQETQGTALTVANVSSGFNVYGVMWGPQTVDLYINHIEVASMPTPADMNVPMYMLANLAVGGYWPGDPNSSTVFPANMLINYVHAYAYPGTTGGTVYDTTAAQNIGPAPLAPVTTLPATLQATSNVATAIAGISVASNWPGGYFTIVISDSTGYLQTNATADVISSGEGTASLTLTGNLAPLNAALATMTYQGAGNEWIWVSATDPQGLQSSSHIAVTVGTGGTTGGGTTPVVTTPASVSTSAGKTAALNGINIADSQSSASISVAVSDSTGLLHTKSIAGVSAKGENTTVLTLSGSLQSVNTALASLTYKAGSATGADWLWVSANAQDATQGLGHVVVNVAPVVNAKPVVAAPAAVTLAPNATAALHGVSVACSGMTGNVCVAVSDSTGLLHVTAEGITLQGQGSTVLTLNGSLAAVNASLASLTYTANAGVQSDWLWVSADNTAGTQGLNHVVVNITAPASTKAVSGLMASPPGQAMGITVMPIASDAGAQTGTKLAAGVRLMRFAETGGNAIDKCTYHLSGSGASDFKVSNTGTLATAAAVPGTATGKLYALDVTVTDSTANVSSAPQPINVVVGSTGQAHLALAQITNFPASVPCFIYPGGGNHVGVDATGLSARAVFFAGTDTDVFTGGSGVNDYVFGSTADSMADLIRNFQPSQDVIDFTGLSAHLNFAGSISGSSLAADSIGYQSSGGNTHIYANTSGVVEAMGSTDIRLELLGNLKLTATNFMHN